MKLIVFLLTMFITTRQSLLYDNITGVSMMNEYHIIVILYTFFISIFFVYEVTKIYRLLPIQNKYIYFMIYITGILMALGSLFPYSINQHDLFSQLHVALSFLPCASFVFILFYYHYLLSIYYPSIHQKVSYIYYVFIQFLVILFIVLGRVNGFIELYFMFIVCFDLYLIEHNFKLLNT